MENILRRKLALNIDPRAQEIIDILSISGDVKILGSQKYQSQLYAGDYDLYEIVKGRYGSRAAAAAAYVKKIQAVVRKLMNERDVFIGDIKSGERDGEPVRWKPSDILDGAKDGLKLADAFQQPALTKLDVVAWVNGRYTDFSIIYEFKNKTETLNPVKSDPKASIRQDEADLKREGEYFKALKRRFSIAALERRKGALIRLNRILNSDLGRLYLIISDLKTLLYLFENKERVPHDRLEYELEQMRVRFGFLSTMPAVNSPTILKRLEALETASAITVTANLTSLIDDLSKRLNRAAKAAGGEGAL